MKVLALAWMLAALLVAGCGGGGDDEVEVRATWRCGGGVCAFTTIDPESDGNAR